MKTDFVMTAINTAIVILMIAKVMAVSLNYELSDSDDGETDLDGTVTATSADESADPAF